METIAKNVEKNAPELVHLVFTQEEKSLIGAIMQEMPVSQQYALSTLLKTGENRAVTISTEQK
ncbi:hypothetical protein [Runella sp.]|uniref:hypothetical protein n=1 Tax=Runella sp. TaxID=1960881 RepID=UPI003D0F9802